MLAHRRNRRLLLYLVLIFSSACAISAPTDSRSWLCEVEQSLDLNASFRCELQQADSELNLEPKTDSVKDQSPNRNQKALADTLDGCGKAMDFYEKSAVGVYTFTNLIALTGAIAGGVVVPMLTAAANANKAQIAAWGGVSGVANTAQTGLRQIPAQALQVRESIRSNLATALDEYAGADNEPARAKAIQRAINACFAYSIQPVAPKPRCGGLKTLDKDGKATITDSCIEGAKPMTCASKTTGGPACSVVEQSTGSASLTGGANDKVIWAQP